MAQVSVTIVNPGVSANRSAQLPDDVPASDIVRALVKRMKLPLQHQGEPVSYRLHHKQTGRILAAQQSLRDAGVQDGHTLRLQAELIAG